MTHLSGKTSRAQRLPNNLSASDTSRAGWCQTLTRCALPLLVWLATAELAAAVATRVLVHWGWMAWIPTVSQERVAYNIAHSNPVLGWGPPLDANGRATELQARPDPAFGAGDPVCASTYGDSFTAGAEVGDEATYPHYLGARLACRVANYGMSGYGTDQALMLFRAQRALDTAPVVVLGHVSENVMRNVNQYRDLLYPGEDQELYFKPAFSLRDGRLEVVPVPVRTAADFQAFQKHPDGFLSIDAFRGRPRRSFPYSAALARWAVVDFHVRTHVAGIPRYAPFYDSADPSGALPLTVAILRVFAEEALTRGQRPIVLLIPVGDDFRYHQRIGVWVDQPLADRLRQARIPVVQAGPLMLLRLRGADPCTLFRDCDRHFNARGYSLLADVLEEEMRRQDLLTK